MDGLAGGAGPRRAALSRAWILAVVVIGILALGDLNRRMANAAQLEQDGRLLRAEVATLEFQQSDLQTQIAAVVDDQTVEQWARREAKMHRQGERLIIPIPADGGAAAPLPPNDPAPPLPSPWEVWWALIFGE